MITGSSHSFALPVRRMESPHGEGRGKGTGRQLQQPPGKLLVQQFLMFNSSKFYHLSETFNPHVENSTRFIFEDF